MVLQSGDCKDAAEWQSDLADIKQGCNGTAGALSLFVIQSVDCKCAAKTYDLNVSLLG